MSKAKHVVAFEYDNAGTGAEHPVEFGVIPGVWEPGVPVLASAFGMTVGEVRDAIKEFALPLVEVHVAEGDALEELPHVGNRFESEQDHERLTPAPDNRVRLTRDGPIPAGPSGANHPPLQPLAAAMQARNTVLSRGGTLEDAASAAEAAGGDAGELLARMTRSVTENPQDAALPVVDPDATADADSDAQGQAEPETASEESA